MVSADGKNLVISLVILTMGQALWIMQSVVTVSLCEKMEEVLIGEQNWDLKSDHKPTYLSFSELKNNSRG